VSEGKVYIYDRLIRKQMYSAVLILSPERKNGNTAMRQDGQSAMTAQEPYLQYTVAGFM
jgi:hypothetical protein